MSPTSDGEPTPEALEPPRGPQIHALAGGRVAVELGGLVAEAPTRANGKWTVRAGGVSDRVNPDAAREVKQAAKALGVPEDAVRAVLAAGLAEQRRRLDAAAATPATTAAPFTVAAWDRGQTRAQRQEFTAADPLEALDQACTSGLEFLSWAGGRDRLCAVDVDVTPEGGIYRATDLAHVVRRTGADRGWVTRSRGLRLVFGAADHLTALQRALVGILLGGLGSADPSRVEIKTDTRRPSSRVEIGDTPTGVAADYAAGRGGLEAVGEDAVAEWLAPRGMAYAPETRYPHDLCPIAPGSTGGTDPVVIRVEGIQCYRCGTFRHWSALLADRPAEPHPLIVAARSWVHLGHMRVELAQWFPLTRVSPSERERLLPAAWEGLLRLVHLQAVDNSDDRVALMSKIGETASPHRHPFVRGEGGSWLSGPQLEPIHLHGPTVLALPWVGGAPDRMSLALSRSPLEGFRQVRPISGVVYRPEVVPPGVLLVPTAPAGHAPLELLPDVTQEQFRAALDLLAQVYPGIDETYTCLLGAGAACAEAGGKPRTLLVHGPSGSGKSQGVVVVSGILRCLWREVPLNVDADEDWTRQVGAALQAGARILSVDEVARVHALGSRLRRLLTLRDPYTFRPLHEVPLQVGFRAVVVMTAITIPEGWAYRPEISRRIRVIRQHTCRDWTGAPTVEEWAAQDPTHAHARRVIVSWFGVLARQHGYDWDRLAEALGARALVDYDPQACARVTRLRQALARYLLGEEGVRSPSRCAVYHADDGWWDLTAAGAATYVTPMLGGGEHARFLLTQDLCALDWAALLGRPVRIEVRQQGGHWVGRAVEEGA